MVIMMLLMAVTVTKIIGIICSDKNAWAHKKYKLRS